MRLLSLDHAVWQEILLNWLGTLRDVVCLDLSIDKSDVNQQFRDVFEQLVFPLPSTVRVSQDLLLGLCSWMKKRNVYLNRVEVEKYLNEWEEILVWCGNSLRKLHMTEYCEDTVNFLNSTIHYCCCLQEFAVRRCAHQDGATLSSIIRNNASTLVVLIMEKMFDDDSSVSLEGICCPLLQVLSWENGNCTDMGVFLQKCPKLFAVSVNRNGNRAPDSFISALAESCPLLKMLRLSELAGLDSNALLRIAHGCSMLEHFEISDCEAFWREVFVEVLQALPHLHTFHTDTILSEANWLEIAARGLAPSLRVLDVFTAFSCAGFRQFTAVYPHLTGLRVRIIDIGINLNNSTLFEYCGEMKHIVLWMFGESMEAVDALLESVAMCCPNLEVLELNYGTQCHSGPLQNVLDKCSKLKYFSHYRRSEALKVQIPPWVTVTNDCPPLTPRMPTSVQ